mmetsp:Transcript_17345/g.36018  ORF Transcript_17345/g.36018 Transcript_17345/m.36018 type:complete len:153 (-) Transcript_17345:413-871(-)
MLNQQFAVRGGSNGVSWGNVVWRRGSDLLPWEYAQLIELCNSQVVSACSWRPLGSQTKRVPLKATAFYMRGGDAILYANFRKLDPAYESARWQFYRILSNVNFGSYLNYGDLTLHNYSRMYWSENLPRLGQIKAKYDPDQWVSNIQGVPLPT